MEEAVRVDPAGEPDERVGRAEDEHDREQVLPEGHAHERAARLREEERAGKDQRINAQNAEATAARLVERLHKRQAELERERQISALPPVLKGAALIIPRGLLKTRLPAAPTPESPTPPAE